MLTDIQIAQSCKLKPINQIGEDLGIENDELELYGKYKAKLNNDLWERVKNKPNGKLVLVTAINPTPAGEEKRPPQWAWASHGSNRRKGNNCAKGTFTRSGHGDKGRCCGGGYSQVVPMEDINLHLRGICML